MTGKGSMRRPFDRNKFDNNYDKVFGRTSKQQRHLDLSELQSAIYMFIKSNKKYGRPYRLIVTFTKADSESVSTALQTLSKKGSIKYSRWEKVWRVK